MGLVEVVGDVPLELLHKKRCTFRPASLVTHWVLDRNLVYHGTVVQCDGNGVANRSLRGVMVIYAECLLFLAVYLSTELVDAWVGRRGVSTTETGQKVRRR